jgi:hypothetical protein
MSGIPSNDTHCSPKVGIKPRDRHAKLMRAIDDALLLIEELESVYPLALQDLILPDLPEHKSES